jgi:PAS domain S-box-containing protein
MKISKIKNLLLLITLIIIFLIDFGLIANTNNKWNETVKKIETLTFETSVKEEYIKNALQKRNEEFKWALFLFVLSNFIGIVLLYLYRKEKNEYELKLHNEKEKAIITLKSIADAVITTDENAIITFINPIAQKILAYSKEEIIGKDINKILNIIDTKTNEPINLDIKEVLNIGKIRILNENIGLLNRKKELFEIEDSFAPIKNKDGEILGAVFVFHDVTEQNRYRRKLAENEKIMLQQSKLSAMAEMLENMAHHWRQPLSLISTLATGVKIKKEINDLDDKYLIESLENINQSSQNLSKIIDDFTIFLKPTSRKKEFFLLDKSLEKVITIFESKLKAKNIQLTLNTKEEIGFYGCENELMQVFMGIINNSIDALILKEDRFIFIDIHRNENEVIIEFLDSGGGVSIDIIDRIFEPYFTTKHKSQGKGINLYIIEEMIKNLFSGKIKVENENFSFKDKKLSGAKFSIFLKSEE